VRWAGRDAVFESERPQAVDRKRPTLPRAQLAAELEYAALDSLIGGDLAVAMVAGEEIETEAARLA
jgi:hypothetical protein